MSFYWTFPLLFCSGLTALTYQVVWMREFRLVFGASTAATAAVSALFMAGLGVGGWLLGPRADKQKHPLAFYGILELGISLMAAISPWLLHLTRSVYLESGGMASLGFWGATAARMALSIIVLAIPTILMGGTLPAAVKAVTAASDGTRRNLGVLYGVNTLGALTGVVLTTFWLMELFGAKQTLMLAVLANALLAIAAILIGRSQKPRETEEPALTEELISGSNSVLPQSDETHSDIPSWLALTLAAGAGFAFFLMELVWYRMLSPILGGSTYTFGLILAVALAGIGLGGAAYPLLTALKKPSAGMLALTCLLEALAMLLPFAAGDSIAVLTAQLRPMDVFGFTGLLGVWTIICIIVVFPASFISGIQFPLIIALMGKGSRGVGKQTGLAYACNTSGAIAGSLAGGFGFMPWLTAPGCWLLSGGVLALLGVLVCVQSVWKTTSTPGATHRTSIAAAALVLLATLPCFFATGPTAAWRHSPIGAGRQRASTSLNNIHKWSALTRLYTLQETDGVESSVGINIFNGYAFIINGKSDGNVIEDRGMQIMNGMIGAALHPNPQKAFVVGLGTGCTAGWLSAVDSMERVDVVELEPAILETARLCAPANHDVVGKAERGENVRILINDAREVLTTIPERYDIIASEPSNPYRAGIASLFSQEFYKEVANRLTPNGIFINWCQAYEIDLETVVTILATLRTVFPYVECWNAQANDLLFISSMEPIVPDVELLRARLAAPPFSDAMHIAWRSEGLEGFLSRHVANSAMIDQIVMTRPVGINSDDRLLVEYGFARTVGKKNTFSANELIESTWRRGHAMPLWTPSDIDGDKLLSYSLFNPILCESPMPPFNADNLPEETLARIKAAENWVNGFPAAAEQGWRNASPKLRIEHLAFAELLAGKNDEKTLDHLSHVNDWWPASAALIRARLALANDDADAAVEEFEKAFASLKQSPWESKVIVERGLFLAKWLAQNSPSHAERIYRALNEPFSMYFLEVPRRTTLYDVAMTLGAKRQEEVLAKWFEPNPPWEYDMLGSRMECYRATGNPLFKKAEKDFILYNSLTSSTLEEYLGPVRMLAQPTETPIE